jgi:hypothetical protein
MLYHSPIYADKQCRQGSFGGFLLLSATSTVKEDRSSEDFPVVLESCAGRNQVTTGRVGYRNQVLNVGVS